jgi:hypothetical protein
VLCSRALGTRSRIVERMPAAWLQRSPTEWFLIDGTGRTVATLEKKEGSGGAETGEYYISVLAEDRLVECSSLEDAQKSAEALADLKPI